MTDSNVIKYPKQFTPNLNAPTFEQVQESLELQRINQIVDVTSALADEVVQMLIQLGYDFPVGTKAEKDFFLVIESIRSMICKYHDEEHAFHNLAEHSFEVLDDDGSFVFLAPKIKLAATTNEMEPNPDDTVGC